MQLAGQVAGTAAGPVLKIANGAVMVLGFGIAILAYSPIPTLAVLAILSANMALLWAANRALADTSGDAQMLAGGAHGTSMQGIALPAESCATGMVLLLYRRLTDACVDEANAQQRSIVVARRMAAVPFFCSHVLALAVLGLGSYQVMRAEMTLGSLPAFQMLARMFAGPLQSVIGLGTAIPTTSGSVVRLRDLFEARPRGETADDAPACAGVGARECARLRGQITLAGLGFGYPGRRRLFANLSAEFAPGTMSLIVGGSGSGKTALAMLPAGILTPDAGTIRWDGVAADLIPGDLSRTSLGLAEQAPFFAGGTLKDALSLRDPDRADAQFRDALRSAEMDGTVQARRAEPPDRRGRRRLQRRRAAAPRPSRASSIPCSA